MKKIYFIIFLFFIVFTSFTQESEFDIQKKILDDFILLAPSECHTFPGGIEYQNAFETFNTLISQN